MRAPALFQVSIRRFGIWRAAVLAAASVVTLSMLAWVVTQPDPLGPWWLGFSGLAVLASLWFAMSLWRLRPVSLRWDGQVWHLGPVESAGHEPWPGQLSLAMDLGPWMLLRFRPGALNRGARSMWIPVQRSGLEPQWHALRCAVYCARPAPGAIAEAGFQPPPHERS